ncbi:hypothetical protein IWW57_006847, partial [Coemansia sp. S610]
VAGSVGQWVLVLSGLYVLVRVINIFLPPVSNDGGVPHIPVHKTLQWMTKGAIGRYEV